MDFWIQASAPRCSGDYDPGDTTLDEAVETVFPLQTESALLVWRHVYVPLSYRYDVSVISVDLIAVISSVLVDENGVFEIHWPSSNFNARWVLRWDHTEILIEAEWLSVTGGNEGQLNALDAVKMPKLQFVSEWKEVIGRVLSALSQCGYRAEQIRDLERLEQVYADIPSTGLLYLSAGKNLD